MREAALNAVIEACQRYLNDQVAIMVQLHVDLDRVCRVGGLTWSELGGGEGAFRAGARGGPRALTLTPSFLVLALRYQGLAF